MRIIITAAFCLAATAASAVEYKDDAKSQLVRLVVAAQCPDLPEALEIAEAKARSFSAANPRELPAKDLDEAIAIARENAATETNKIATAFCKAIIDSAD